MAQITSKTQLIDYVKSQLGEPTIRVEVTSTQLGEIIDSTIQKFTEYAYGTLEETVVLNITGMGKYAMPAAITNIIAVSRGGTVGSGGFTQNYGAGYVPDLWSDQFFNQSSITGGLIPQIIGISSKRAAIDKFFGDEINYNFNYLAKQLHVLENWNGSVLVHYEYEYLANDANDFVFNHEWIKAYTKARTKELWGTVTGKYDQALVGGARINYDRLLQEAQQEIEKLDEELLNRWSDPCSISIS